MNSTANPSALGEFLRTERERVGISKRQLAEAIGVDHAYIIKLENGERKNPSGEVLQGIADALKIDVAELLAFVGVRPSYPEPTVYFRKVYGMTDQEAREAAKLLEKRRPKQR